VANLYDADPRLARHFDSALRAHALYKRDRDYIVEGGEIVIVDEFTGRKMPGRRWSEGLHQAVEAKEGLRVQRESRTLATITFQNYFRLYDKLAGMTGTAMTEAEEFHKIYKLEVVAVPTHRPMIRDDLPDLVFRNEKSKFTALIDEIEEMVEAGRPVLVGTVSVEKSEVLGELLKRRGIRHDVLNAKQHEREAGIVAQAGHSGNVTIATNMAGRGTDIKLGGDPAGLASDLLHKRGLNPAEVDADTYQAALAEARETTEENHETVVAAGGLHIIGTERHESRRIDNQLRGRAGRQGDPGSSRFYLSLDDDLMKRFASDRVAGLMGRLGLDDDVAIESRLVSRTIEQAQTRVEGFNFDIRKRVVEFDDVINRQRETIYAERDKVLRNEDLGETVLGFLDEELEHVIGLHTEPASPAEWDLAGLATALTAMGLTGPGTTEDELADAAVSREALTEHLQTLAEQTLEAKQEQYGDVDWSQAERYVLLRTIDSLWVEHLTEVDDMRRGIGLRGYAQQDPLNEFRKEAFRLYQELRDLIRRQVATTILRVSVSRNPPPQAGPFAMPGPGQPPRGPSTGNALRPPSGGRQPGRADGSDPHAGHSHGPIAGPLPADPMRGAREAAGIGAAASGAAAAGGARPGYTPTGARIGRNDPCWCGSGNKYKKCHGR
jgi:preprotein translocase subunit SecA